MRLNIERIRSQKANKIFEDYVYSSPDSSFYQHPRTIANDEYGVKYKGVRDVNKYSQDTEKFKIVLSDGSIKEPMSLYDGKPEWDDYNLFLQIIRHRECIVRTI